MAMKLLLVYAGPFHTTWTSYNAKALATEYGATDFLLLSTEGFNYVKAGGSPIITDAWIDANITTNGAICADTTPAGVAQIKTDTKIAYKKIDGLGSNPYNFEKYVSDVVTLAKNICTANTNAKIWFGLPPLPASAHVTAELFATPYKTGIIDLVKTQMTAAGRWGNVAGFYFGQEDIIQWYTKFDRASPSTDYNNVVCKCMRAVSDYVHSSTISKKLLWIPYFNDTAGNEIATRDGMVINQKNYFDIAILQPSYYFNANMGQSNLDLVKRCATNKRCEYIGGGIIGGSKTSKTEIGIEIEADEHIGDADRQWLTRFEAYANTYGPMRGPNYHFAFYAGGVEALKSDLLKVRIAGFFSV